MKRDETVQSIRNVGLKYALYDTCSLQQQNGRAYDSRSAYGEVKDALSFVLYTVCFGGLLDDAELEEDATIEDDSPIEGVARGIFKVGYSAAMAIVADALGVDRKAFELLIEEMYRPAKIGDRELALIRTLAPYNETQTEIWERELQSVATAIDPSNEGAFV